jgi:hypothetical protein
MGFLNILEGVLNVSIGLEANIGQAMNSDHTLSPQQYKANIITDLYENYFYGNIR